jgi:hypothetical protein
VGLVAEVIEVHLVHQPLDGHLDLAAALARRDPIAHADELHTVEPEPVVQAHRLVHLAGETREIFD